MSQQFNNSFDNNEFTSSSSSQHGLNGMENEPQETLHDNNLEETPENALANDLSAINRQESNLNDSEQTCFAPEANMQENKLLIPSEEHPVSADVSRNELENNSDNNLSAYASNQESIHSYLSEIIQQKIKAVKNFAFCKIGDKKVPVYPYVVALTGHRDAITEPVKEIAKNQLRSLAKAWDKACNAKKWKKTYANKNCKWKCTERVCEKTQKSAPLIALVGLDDGESGKLWTKIASELRDEEKFNIKVAAVTSMPLKYQDFSQSDFAVNLKNYDGLIELPVEKDAQYILDNIEYLGSVCNSNEQQNNELKRNLLNNFLLDLQFDEYRKFMCVHSHALIALVNNIEKKRNVWEKYNNELNKYISNVDYIEESTSQKAIYDTIDRYQHKVETIQSINDLISQVVGYNKQNNTTVDSQRLQNSFDHLQELISSFNIYRCRTEALIRYKLFGDIESKLFPSNENEGISLTSIGPIACIQTEQNNGKNAHSHASPKMTFIVKDQPDDNKYDLTKLITSFSSVDKFPEIKNVINTLGNLNNRILENSPFIQNSNRSNIQSNGKDEGAFTQHYLYASFLSKKYFSRMKHSIRITAFIALLFLLLISLYSKIPYLNSSIYLRVFVFSILIVLYLISKINYWLMNYHTYHHRYRALADALQIQHFWKIAGSDEDVAGHYYLHQIRDISWLRTALNSLGVTFFSEYNRISYNENDSLQLDDIIQLGYNEWEKYLEVKNSWVDAKLSKLTGKNRTFKDKVKDHIEYGLNCCSPFGGIAAAVFYFLSLFFTWLSTQTVSIDNLLNKLNLFLNRYASYIELKNNITYWWNQAIATIELFDLLLYNYPVYKYSRDWLIYSRDWLISIYLPLFKCTIFAILVFSAILMVYNAYRISSLKDLDIKRRRQLLYPFQRAHLLLNINLGYFKKSITDLVKASNSSEVSNATESCFQNYQNNNNGKLETILRSSINFKNILEGLGKIELAISAEWLLGVRKRQFDLDIIHHFKKLFKKKNS